MHRRSAMVVGLTALLWATALAPLLAEDAAPSAERKKIEALLSAVARADAVFIRNGSRHTPEEAANHMRRKLNNATRGFFGFGKPKKVSVEAFITKIASHSSTTDKPYLIEHGGKKPYPVERWLRSQLKRLEKRKR